MKLSRAVLLVGHGTRDAQGRADFATFVDAIRRQAGLAPDDRSFAACFLELAPPDPVGALLELQAQGCARVTMVPALLFSAGHMKRDLPGAVAQARAHGLGIPVELRDAVGVKPLFADVSVARIRETELWRCGVLQSRRVGVLFVGRGTSDALALGDLHRMADAVLVRLAAEDADVCLRVCTMTGAVKTVEEGLEELRADGADAVIVAPYLLFRGVLTRRLATIVEDWQRAHPAIACAAAATLGGHPDVVRTFAAACTVPPSDV